MKKKLNIGEMQKLLTEFDNVIVPWCEENELSLHRAFEMSRATEPEKYNVLSLLWSTEAGKEYLRSFFRSRGGVLKRKS